MSEHGQKEGDGFPAAGLSDADEVSARHDGRDCLSLDGGGLVIAVPTCIIEKGIYRNMMNCFMVRRFKLLRTICIWFFFIMFITKDMSCTCKFMSSWIYSIFQKHELLHVNLNQCLSHLYTNGLPHYLFRIINFFWLSISKITDKSLSCHSKNKGHHTCSHHESDSLLHSAEDLHGHSTLHPGLDGFGTALPFDDNPFQLQPECIHICSDQNMPKKRC